MLCYPHSVTRLLRLKYGYLNMFPYPNTGDVCFVFFLLLSAYFGSRCVNFFPFVFAAPEVRAFTHLPCSQSISVCVHVSLGEPLPSQGYALMASSFRRYAGGRNRFESLCHRVCGQLLSGLYTLEGLGPVPLIPLYFSNPWPLMPRHTSDNVSCEWLVFT